MQQEPELAIHHVHAEIILLLSGNTTAIRSEKSTGRRPETTNGRLSGGLGATGSNLCQKKNKV